MLFPMAAGESREDKITVTQKQMEYRGRVPVEAPPPAAAQSTRSREPINPFEQRRDERASMLSFLLPCLFSAVLASLWRVQELS
jgi:hypothetical protein